MKQKILSAAIAGVLILGACSEVGDRTEPASGGTTEGTQEDASGGGQKGDTGGGQKGDESGGGKGNTGPSSEVEFFGTEYAFEGPETIAAGKTTFTLINQGKKPHLLVMLELLNGKTRKDVDKFLKENGVTGEPPTWVDEVEGEAFAKPGKDAQTEPVDLTPGTYVLLCFVTDKGAKKTHAELGMTRQLTVE